MGPAGTRGGPCIGQRHSGLCSRRRMHIWRTAGWIDDLTIFVATACAHAIRIVGCNFLDNDRYVPRPGLEMLMIPRLRQWMDARPLQWIDDSRLDHMLVSLHACGWFFFTNFLSGRWFPSLICTLYIYNLSAKNLNAALHTLKEIKTMVIVPRMQHVCHCLP